MGSRGIRYFESKDGKGNLGLIWILADTSGHCIHLSVAVFQRDL
jgi:hypothetical protein